MEDHADGFSRLEGGKGGIIFREVSGIMELE